MESFLKIGVVLFGFVTAIVAHARVINVPLYSKMISLDPTGMQDQSSLWVSRHVNCQLVRLEGSQTALDAASKINFKSPTEIEITLKEDARFHDGTPLKADDVIASLNFIKESRSVLRNIFQWINGYKILSQKKMLIILKEPVPHFLRTLSGPNYAIFKKEFIQKARANKTLWKTPLGCGSYKVDEYQESKYVLISPVFKKGPKIAFHLFSENQVSAEKANMFDIIGVPIVGKKELADFKTYFIFDPYQIFIGLNTKLPRWKEKANRCNLFSHLDRTPIMNSYGDLGRVANDFFPKGVIGYNEDANFEAYYKKLSNSKNPPNNFCLSIIAASIPEIYRDSFSRILPFEGTRIEKKLIKNPKTFGKTFQGQQCDALVIGLKTNYLDGYEYLLIFSEENANFTGYKNEQLINEIKRAQNVEDFTERALTYQHIADTIKQRCLVYPLVTLPMKKIFVKKTLRLENIGKGPLNEYYLGNVE